MELLIVVNTDNIGAMHMAQSAYSVSFYQTECKKNPNLSPDYDLKLLLF